MSFSDLHYKAELKVVVVVSLGSGWFLSGPIAFTGVPGGVEAGVLGGGWRAGLPQRGRHTDQVGQNKIYI